ncbi:hypothetical protein STEG23_025564, partial [Scotinomys teguina]
SQVGNKTLNAESHEPELKPGMKIFQTALKNDEIMPLGKKNALTLTADSMQSNVDKHNTKERTAEPYQDKLLRPRWGEEAALALPLRHTEHSSGSCNIAKAMPTVDDSIWGMPYLRKKSHCIGCRSNGPKPSDDRYISTSFPLQGRAGLKRQQPNEIKQDTIRQVRSPLIETGQGNLIGGKESEE